MTTDSAIEDTPVAQATKRSPILYAIAAWMVINIFLMAIILLGGDVQT